MSPSSSGRPVAQGLYCQGPVILTLQDKTRQEKTFIIVTLQVQLLGTQLARKR